jgi:hypothetical protein
LGSTWEVEVKKGYIYEDELPCELTMELYMASILDGVRMYPIYAVVKQMMREVSVASQDEANGTVDAEMKKKTKGHKCIGKNIWYWGNGTNGKCPHCGRELKDDGDRKPKEKKRKAERGSAFVARPC